MADTNKEANIRPIVLRSGFVPNWNTVKPIPEPADYDPSPPFCFEFAILKNIAKDIQGFVVVGGYKYQLLFGNNISAIGQGQIQINTKWGWMKPDTQIFAWFTQASRESTHLENQVYIKYQDIEGNTYFTREDKDFKQVTLRLT